MSGERLKSFIKHILETITKQLASYVITKTFPWKYGCISPCLAHEWQASQEHFERWQSHYNVCLLRLVSVNKFFSDFNRKRSIPATFSKTDNASKTSVTSKSSLLTLVNILGGVLYAEINWPLKVVMMFAAY